MLIFLQYVLPSLLVVLSSVLSTILAVKFKYSKMSVDDAAVLRQCLMAERKELVKEIADLRARCDALEAENQLQAQEMGDLKEKNRQLIAEIKHFGNTLPNE